MATKIQKRFIAGAVCPRCSAMDKIVTYKENDKEYRECVSCGYLDEMRFKQNLRELETRVNVTEEDKQTQTQVLTLDPKGSDRKN
jgi:uncharacterized metal-binding protein (TIGR02443 family)